MPIGFIKINGETLYQKGLGYEDKNVILTTSDKLPKTSTSFGAYYVTSDTKKVYRVLNNRALKEQDIVYETIVNEVHSNYSCKNTLTYAQSPERDLMGNLHNEGIDTFYVPRCTFNLGYVNEDIYSQLIQKLNTRAFYLEYYDYELRQNVIRDMYLTDNSLEKFLNVGANIKAFTNVSLEFVSRKAYSSYSELKVKGIEAFDDVIVSVNYTYSDSKYGIDFTITNNMAVDINIIDFKIIDTENNSYTYEREAIMSSFSNAEKFPFVVSSTTTGFSNDLKSAEIKYKISGLGIETTKSATPVKN